MLQKIEDVAANVLGFKAIGKLTREDYEKVLLPTLQEYRAQGKHMRFLYQFGADFTGFTPGAAWDDFKIGLQYTRLFDRCAVVSNAEWIRHAAQLFGSMIPCPTRAFKSEEIAQAKEWLAGDVESSLGIDMIPEGVAIVRPHGSLRREDFQKLADVVDPWIEQHKELKGVVICAEKIPGWENLGSFLQHLTFVREHHKKVKRVALAVDGVVPDLLAKVASHFVVAEAKHFACSECDKAVEWAKNC